jgi:myosin heavy subunit
MKALTDDTQIYRQEHQLRAPYEWFGIKHFAGPVVYNVTNFVEKNKDLTNVAFTTLLQTSSNPIIKALVPTDSKRILDKHQNVITLFREQLKQLMSILNQSSSFYIRCIKPNGNKSATEFDARDVRR